MQPRVVYRHTFVSLCAMAGIGLAWHNTREQRYVRALHKAIAETPRQALREWRSEDVELLDMVNSRMADKLTWFTALQQRTDEGLRDAFLAIAYEPACDENELELCAAILEEWIRRNPREVLDCLFGDAHLAVRFPSAITYALSSMARRDAHATIEYLNTEGMERCGYLSQMAVEELARADIDWATGPLIRTVNASNAVLRGLMEVNSDETMRKLQEVGTPIGRATLVVAAGEWLAVDREAALGWLATQAPDVKKRVFYQAVQEGCKMQQADLQAFAPVTQDMIRMQMRKFDVGQKSEEALEWAGSLQGHERTWALQEVAIAARESEVGQKALALIDSYDRITEALAGMGTSALREGADPAAMSEWMKNLSPREQAVVVPAVLGAMTLRYPEVAVAHLSSMTEPSMLHAACGNIIDRLRGALPDAERQQIIYTLQKQATPEVVAAFRKELMARGIDAEKLGL